MKKTYQKNIIILAIILILCSPIISSKTITNIKEDENFQKTSDHEIIIDDRIIEILDKINESMLQEHMKALMKIGRRMTGTYGCEKAAKYIYEQFESMGLETKFHNWTAFGDRYHKGFYKSQNVIATLPGKDESCNEIITFTAHYDSVRPGPGANDDGSGTCAVLVAAYVLSQYEFNRTIKFITVSGEEVGLLGSSEYAKRCYLNDDNILYEFNADMIGYAITAKGGRNMGISTTEDAGWIANLFENITNDYGMNFNIRHSDIDLEDRGWSDYYPFSRYGYEAIACWGGTDKDPNYHQPTDDYDNINFSFLVNTTRHIVGSMAYVADFNNPYPQIIIKNPKRGRLFYKDRPVIDFTYDKIVVIKDVHIYAEVKPGEAEIEKVEFYYDDKLEFTDTELPYEWGLDKKSIRKHKVKAVAYDTLGNTACDTIFFHYYHIRK